MQDESEKPHALACTEVWGGNRKVSRTVKLPSLMAWVEEGDDPQPKKVAGLPVGLIPGTDYSQTVVTLKPSDPLVLYTDGITEAENGTKQELGRERF